MAEAAENKAPATETTPAKTTAASKPKPASKPAARKAAAGKKAPTKKAVTKTASSKPAAKAQTAKKTAARKTTSAKKTTPKATPPRKSATSGKAAAPKATKSATTAETVTNEPKVETSTTHETSSEQAEQKSSHAGFDSDKLIAELKEKDWGSIALRGIFMLLFGFLANIGLMATFVLAVIQFIVMVGTGQPSDVLTSIITRLATYIGQSLNFLSFKTEDMPFPLGLDLPSED